MATVASAPAAELVPLLNETYNSTLAWVIGPEVLTSWPATYRGLPIRPILTGAGYDNYRRIAEKCITSAAAEGLIRNAVKQRFFNGNPVNNSRWKTIAQQQTAPVLTASQPVMVVESLTDQVVLPNTTALYIQRAPARLVRTSRRCGSPMSATSSSPRRSRPPSWTGWVTGSRTGRTAPTCDHQLPIAPAAS